MKTTKRIECCPDATCPKCVRRQEKAASELNELTEATRRRQFNEMVAARQADGWQQ
jgi:hypothetical protein